LAIQSPDFTFSGAAAVWRVITRAWSPTSGDPPVPCIRWLASRQLAPSALQGITRHFRDRRYLAKPPRRRKPLGRNGEGLGFLHKCVTAPYRTSDGVVTTQERRFNRVLTRRRN